VQSLHDTIGGLKAQLSDTMASDHIDTKSDQPLTNPIVLATAPFSRLAQAFSSLDAALVIAGNATAGVVKLTLPVIAVTVPLAKLAR
jgi:hypothetical protein